MKTKVILDTDIGNDIDDAVCLAYLLAQPDCELLGITTVSGAPIERAKICSVLTKIAGKEIPIYPGLDTPLLTEQHQKTVPQADRLPNWEHDTEFPEAKAISFLQDTVRKNPGEVVLLTIGGLTNTALLFATDPEIPSLLKSLVMMVGVFTNRVIGRGGVEWNAGQDPYAASIMYRHEADVHRSVGLDVTAQVKMDKEQVRERFQHPLLKPVLDFADVWFGHRDIITFHDPLAAATIFDDDICGFETGNVEVELQSDRLRGMTHWRADPEGRHQVAMEVNPERFFEHYFSVFT